jgi:hypothetical protein
VGIILGVIILGEVDEDEDSISFFKPIFCLLDGSDAIILGEVDEDEAMFD